jgi:hypothetical protein
MLFYKSLVSVVTAIALASSVTASVTPLRRGGGSSTPTCSAGTGSLYCCSSVDQSVFGGLLGLSDLLDLGCLLAGVAGW